jgi:hypothetical protein
MYGYSTLSPNYITHRVIYPEYFQIIVERIIAIIGLDKRGLNLYYSITLSSQHSLNP